jgi:hypothetical protein
MKVTLSSVDIFVKDSSLVLESARLGAAIVAVVVCSASRGRFLAVTTIDIQGTSFLVDGRIANQGPTSMASPSTASC